MFKLLQQQRVMLVANLGTFQTDIGLLWVIRHGTQDRNHKTHLLSLVEKTEAEVKIINEGGIRGDLILIPKLQQMHMVRYIKTLDLSPVVHLPSLHNSLNNC